MYSFSDTLFRQRTIPVLLLLLASSLHAQPQPIHDLDDGEAVTRLDLLLVQGRESNLVGTASSASQGIVGAMELAARPFLRRGELLEVIPGLAITQHSGGGKANQYFLRGFNLDHGTDFALSVDGMPVNLRTHAHGQGYADINFLIPELVQQVDFNKGPFYADVGDFSAAGAAEFKLVDRLPQNFAHVEAGAHQFARVVLGGTHAVATTATTGAFEFTHDDGPWQLEENFTRFNGFLRKSWSGESADYRLTAMAYRAHWQATDQIPLRAVEAGLLDRFGHVDGTNGGESERASLLFNANFNGGAATTRFNAYAIHYRLNLYSNFTYELDDPDNGDQFNQRDRRLILGGALTRTWSATRGDTTVGLDLRHDRIGELALNRTTARRFRSTVRNDDVNETSVGAFARTTTRWTDWLRTDAGVRVDGYAFTVAADNPLNSGRRHALIASPKFSLVLGPWADTEFYANAGDGFHSNDARGTTIRVDPVSGESAERVAPLVRSRGFELGLRTAARRGWVSSLALWSLDLDSELVFVGDAGGTEPSGASRRYGVEWTNFFRATPWLTFDADVALTHARYRDAGSEDRIANSIAQVVTAGFTVGAAQGWFGGARLRYFGAQPLIEDNSVRAPSSITVNARIGWRNARWEVAAEAFNLLDRDNHDIAYFYASRLPGESSDGIEDIHFHPAEPLTLRISVTRRF